MKTVYMDMDGVLTDFVGSAIELLGLTASREDMIHWDSLGHHAAAEGLVPRGEKPLDWVWRTIDEQGAFFWAEMKSLPEGMALLTQLLTDNVPVVFVSAPSRDPFSAAGKLIWLEQNLPNDVYQSKPLHRRFALCPAKHLLAHERAILVDDRWRNVKRFIRKGGYGVTWQQPWSGTPPEFDRTHAQSREILADLLDDY